MSSGPPALTGNEPSLCVTEQACENFRQTRPKGNAGAEAETRSSSLISACLTDQGFVAPLAAGEASVVDQVVKYPVPGPVPPRFPPGPPLALPPQGPL
ncbi:hypothetical protein ACRE_071660 [Hapsidospora chrysogenum ATCC 11550]|uniref:Uncharacterized protein n=1 Tax=Hapsidospora chrysogenum (strain ATCC 11550 / CBS 779.69 / DSM 880 / IAM 14645 / JCM 23072 / IMI 49137) TaxID=857340 RepID=A0A086SYC1_HAPC1|nr:hypothetical protein ACRE_071660 [Hapsidospora chrysogenum ATCC 11550]